MLIQRTAKGAKTTTKSQRAWNAPHDARVATETSKKSAIPKQSSSNTPKNPLAPNGSTTLPSSSASKAPNGVSSARSGSSGTSSTIIHPCWCCGTLLSYPSRASKFRCSVCNTTNVLEERPHSEMMVPTPVSYRHVRHLLDSCLASASSSEKSTHQVFEPLSSYMYESFRSYQCLNQSFRINNASKRAHYSMSNINAHEIGHTFRLLCTLPTKRPLYNCLKGASELARRLYTQKDDVMTYLWVFILLEIPFLSRSLSSKSAEKITTMVDLPEIRELSYDVLKRCLGIISNIDSAKSSNYFASWISKLSEEELIIKIDLINLYITFHLRKYFNRTNNYNARSKSVNGQAHPSDTEYMENWILKEELEGRDPLELPLSKSKSTKSDTRIKLHQYGNDWHIKSAAKVLSIFVKANTIREVKVPANNFYNSLVDFVNVKMDFDGWQSTRKSRRASYSPEADEVQAVLEYIHGKSMSESMSYYFCQYPFLISLGSKISILEYEARRQMERKAEEAFINSLDKRVAIDMYFRVKVRREYVVQDSLNCIKSNPTNLKKSLRVQFLNEPGIDAGGLRKEWFSLLTKGIFSPQTGMLYNVEDSNYLWFNVKPIENFEMYHLFGAILGLAIYNSTILDLKFPLAIYKLLLGQLVGLADYQQLFPVSYKNLMALKKFDEANLSSLDLTFEVTYSDAFGRPHTAELIAGGKKIQVNVSNLGLYIQKYCDFFIKDGIKPQLDAFTTGFARVIGGNGLSLFLAEEIHLLICGNEESDIDIDILKSVTQYAGWSGGKEEATNSQVIQWFWEYFQSLNANQRKKFLVFVTGSDRVPATGIQNLTFKISLMGKDTNRLPVAHTCFNELALYNYRSKAILVDKVSRAVNESAGFGLK
ncbi:uncharacterized protein CANTADRAFT_26604 [Suhomyces tanzawaensis NRRL Y-17324]|uniref:HECT-type E3 ubiquitin transferase n=1 Tax=Suhomyces tanzawaensis NRRL Y-17324 TaxID=984487 RepID=A0A1E4SGB5_9ASCO|nr:uncharacterized protein CANTADRAFT_26604 [Suhomyces tanzawaensis NRRL Y-17324]ODV78553.1 hypothetical protein CANTADRAFT_26604 [Suhomyces tanzawaensis NRRL Y-17324]